MKSLSERINRNMTEPRTMKPISIRIPERVLEDLRELATVLGFSGYQALIKAYISKGLREDFIRLERELIADEVRKSLAGVNVMDEAAIEQAIATALNRRGFEPETSQAIRGRDEAPKLSKGVVSTIQGVVSEAPTAKRRPAKVRVAS